MQLSNGDMNALELTLQSAYPIAPLALVGFRNCRMDKGKHIRALPSPTSATEVECENGRGKLILMPLRDIPLPQVRKYCTSGSHTHATNASASAQVSSLSVCFKI